MNDRIENDRVIGARLNLIRRHVFFGVIAMQLLIEENQELPALAATNGKNLIYNPDETKALVFKELVGLVAHEVMHCVLMHHIRRGNRNPKRWNYATDYVNNLILVEEGFTLPTGGLYDLQYKGMSVEEVYALLPDMPEDSSAGSPTDIVMDGDQSSEAERKAEEGRVKSMIQNAANVARKAGKLSGSMEKLIKAICAPKANWREILSRFVTERAEVDYNWGRPHQRLLNQFGVIYPTLDGERLGKVVLVVDASGSTTEIQKQFAAELSDILGVYDCEVTVIFHDTKVTGVDIYTSDDLPIVMRPRGFGGTCARSAFRYAADEYEPDFIIHLTDMELDYGVVADPRVPVLIASCNTRELKGPCWAEVINIS